MKYLIIISLNIVASYCYHDSYFQHKTAK